MSEVQSTYGPELGQNGNQRTRLPIINSADLLVKCRDEQLRAGVSALWGLHIQSGAVTLLVGQTSAGKTTLLHNLGYHLATGQRFLGLTPPRPLRVLYLDYESHAGVTTEHLDAIGTNPNLDFVNVHALQLGTSLSGSSLLDALQDDVKVCGYEVVIIDPLTDAYPVADENDNAAAITQMRAFRRLATTTKAAVIVVHNTGHNKLDESDNTNPHLGRGASARSDKADVCLNFYQISGDEGKRRRLYVPKSRQSNLYDQIDMRFSGSALGYELVTSSVAPTAGTQLQAQLAKVLSEARDAGGTTITREELRDQLGLAKGDKDDKALGRAITGLNIHRISKGVYAIPQQTEPVDLYEQYSSEEQIADSRNEADDDDINLQGESQLIDAA